MGDKSTGTDEASSSAFRDNAELILPMSIDPQSASRDEQIRQVVLQICPFFSEDCTSTAAAATSPESKLLVKPLLGGLSNELFIVSDSSSSSSELPSILVRIHPPGGEEDDNGEKGHVAVVDREVENRLVAWLSQQKMAPLFYGRFQNGRIEELYPNVSPLSAKEMVPYGPKIATALADFHSLDALPATILPKPHDEEVSSRFQTIDQWVQAIQDASSPHVALLELLSREWKWLRAQLLLSQPSSPASSSLSEVQTKALMFIRQIVLTHMDAQSLNVLKDANAKHGEGEIRLIDFEYAGWNHRAADLANSFCEHCDMNNICADYPAEYPSDAVQNVFLKTYIQRCQPSLIGDESEWIEVLETLRLEIGRFSLLSHLGWAAWSVVMVNEGSAIDFDYVAYAKHRMDGYDYGKKYFFADNS
jgi:thiamine kinase-like enzyme